MGCGSLLLAAVVDIRLTGNKRAVLIVWNGPWLDEECSVGGKNADAITHDDVGRQLKLRIASDRSKQCHGLLRLSLMTASGKQQ